MFVVGQVAGSQLAGVMELGLTLKEFLHADAAYLRAKRRLDVAEADYLDAAFCLVRARESSRRQEPEEK